MRPPRTANGESGGTLLISMLSLAAVTWVTVHALYSITSRMQTAHRSAAWNEALTTAESAVDMTVADLTALLPDVRLNSQEGIALGVSQLPTSIISTLDVTSNGLNLANGVTVSFSPTPLTHGGEGAGVQESTVSLDLLPLSTVLNSGSLNLSDLGNILANPLGTLTGAEPKLVRLRARGTVGLPGRQRVDPNSLDAKLRRPTLVWDRLSGAKATRSTVSRELVVLLKPVLPYQSAVTSGGPVSVDSDDAVFDSFNSTTALTSTNGGYDVAKRLQNGDVHCNAAEVALPAYVYGDVRTAGSSLEKTERITGQVDNTFHEPLPLIRTPTWSGNPLAPLNITTSTTLSAGTLLAPARYKFDSVTGALHITRGLLGLNTDVEIWITGTFTGSLIIDNGVRAKVYVQGNVNLSAGDLVTSSGRAADLQIYGIEDPNNTDTPDIQIALGSVQAAIYAPTHDVRLMGTGDFSGAITCATFESQGAVRVHYDESLALSVGPVIRYAVASWMEQPL